MKNSRSEASLATKDSLWADLKVAEGLKKRSNTAQNLEYYVEEQKRLYQELPFSVLPGMRRQSFQRERSHSKGKISWGSLGSFANHAKNEEKEALLQDEEYFDEPGYTGPLLVSCVVALLSAFQFGYNIGVTGAISPDIMFPGHSSFQWSLCVSAFPIGGPIGSLLAGKASTAYGRKKALIIDAAFFVIAGLIMAFSPSIYTLILGRFVVGLASGAVTVVVPLYLGELAPPSLRGALGTGYQFGVVIGIVAADFLAFPLAVPYNGFSQPGWRLLFGFTAFPALLQMTLSSVLVESPRWLLTKNKPKLAADILRRLRATNDVYEEIDNICSASDNESLDVSVLDVLRDKSIRYPLIVGVVLQISQQLSGINAVMFYANSFFEGIGLTTPLMGTTLVGIVNVVSTGVALLLMDRVGRRPLLLWSCLGMMISAIVLIASMYKIFPGDDMVSIGAMMAYVWFFEIGLGPIPWLIVSEMFPARPRSTAMSIATMVNWICSFIIGISFPFMQSSFGNLTFLPFAFVLLLSYLFTYKYVPETKGKTLEEIQEDLQKN